MCAGDPGIEGGPEGDFIIIGYISRISGIKGDIRVKSMSDIPYRFSSLRNVYVKKRSGEASEYNIRRVREIKQGLIISFDPALTIEEAEDMVGGYLVIPQDEVPELSRDSYYLFEIIGMDVLAEDGKYIGKIADIITTGSNDVYVVEDEEKEHLIPAIHEIIKEVDTKEKRMIISVIKGLID